MPDKKIPFPQDRPAYSRHFSLSEASRGWEMHVTTVGWRRYRPGEPYPGPGHPGFYHFDWQTGRMLPEFALVLITSGAGEYEFRNHAKGRCVEGDVLLITPGQWHRYRPLPRTGWSEFSICADGEYLHRLWSKGHIFTTPHLRLKERYASVRERMIALFQAVRANSELNPGSGSCEPVIAAKALEIISLTVEAAADGRTSGGPGSTDTQKSLALQFIWTNSHRPIRIREVAQAVDASPRTLERKFASGHLRTIREEIEWSRTFRARKLIRETTRPFKEIAFSCGFSDPRRMIDVFQRCDGLTPTEIRKAGADSHLSR